MSMKSESFSRWIAIGVLLFAGIGLLAGFILRAGFGLPLIRVVVPIAVLTTIQMAFFIVMYWVRQRYKQTRDLRVGVVVAGIYCLLLGLVGMYYAAHLGLVSLKAVNEDYFGFPIFMVVVIVIGVGLLSYWKPTQFRQ